MMKRLDAMLQGAQQRQRDHLRPIATRQAEERWLVTEIVVAAPAASPVFVKNHQTAIGALIGILLHAFSPCSWGNNGNSSSTSALLSYVTQKERRPSVG